MSKKTLKIVKRWLPGRRRANVTPQIIAQTPEKERGYDIWLKSGEDSKDNRGIWCNRHPDISFFEGDIEHNIKNLFNRGLDQCLSDLTTDSKLQVEEHEDQKAGLKCCGTKAHRNAVINMLLSIAKENNSSSVPVQCYTDFDTTKISKTFDIEIPLWLIVASKFSYAYARYQLRNESKRAWTLGWSITSLSIGIIGGLVTTGVSLNLLINAGVQAANAAFQSGNAGVYVGLAILALGLTGFITLMCMKSHNTNKEKAFLLSKKNTFLDHHSTEKRSKEYSTEDKLKADCSFSKQKGDSFNEQKNLKNS